MITFIESIFFDFIITLMMFEQKPIESVWFLYLFNIIKEFILCLYYITSMVIS